MKRQMSSGVDGLVALAPLRLVVGAAALAQLLQASDSSSSSTPDGSITTTWLSAGQSDRTSRTFASWSASSTNTAVESEWASTYWHSSAELVW